MRAVVYCRVSTKEQTDNLSLPTQKKACVEYCARSGFDVDRVFIEEGESAKTVNRPQFQELLTYCRENRGRVQAVVVYSLSRFARDKFGHFTVRAILAKLGITLRSVTEPIDDTSTGKLMEGVLAAFAQFDNDVRAERTVAGMRAALERGRWTFKEPLGYRRTIGAAGERTLVHDDSAPLIAKAFDLYATGMQTQREVLRAVTALGLRSRSGREFSPQTFVKMLRNPLYAGRLTVEGWGESRAASFAPIVAPDVFARVQAIMDGQATSSAPRQRNHPDFPLRRFVRCADCDQPITANWSRGRHGGRWAYYRCSRSSCRGINIRRERLEGHFVELVQELTPKPEYVKLFNEIVRDVWREENAGLSSRRKALEVRVAEVRARKEKLDEAFLFAQSIDRATYDAQSARVRETLGLAEIELHDTKLDELDIEAVLAKSEHLIANAGRLWSEAGIDDRQRLQAVLFPEGLVFDGKAFRTPVTCLAFSFFRSAEVENQRWRPQGVEHPTPRTLTWPQVSGWLRTVQAYARVAA